MTTFVVPAVDEDPWPTLGPEVCAFMEEYLVHGPGDIRGEPARISDEFRGEIYRAYEVYPRGHAQAGRRRFKRVALSKRKGTAKTEKAAWIAAVELHPDGPVRCDGWRKQGRQWVPVGTPVRDPFIPMVAYTEEQTEELAYGALYVVLSEGPLADDFDIGYERIKRVEGDGEAKPLANAPDARDGARTTFQHFDETHRFTLPRLREAHQTMQGNIPKRKLADAWSLETTTAPEPGKQSVAEATMQYAQKVADGKVRDPRLFFFHRQAGPLPWDPVQDGFDLSTEEGARAAVLEASGPDAEWSDIESILALWADPQTDRSYFERVWCNRLVQSAAQAFDVNQWRKLAYPDGVPARGELITIGFDGARRLDATAMVATHIASGFQWPLGIWERPANAAEDYEIDETPVHVALEAAFDTYEVFRMYADPPYWETTIDGWAGQHGDKVVIRWWTNRYKAMAYALLAYKNAQTAGELSHNGNATFERHVANARREDLQIRGDSGEPLWVIKKERKDSMDSIDAAMAGCLSWEARRDSIAAGALKKRKYRARGF